ncbi:efflux transporter outer membrane subunit [Pseudomonas capsici]|uniref:efflux transporter outer membrane subunit n=1 Tax=Pseudomonas capsici TaxID=2810614 RepID=UPI0021F0D8D4|nr:efflux transporter outer membrane subunit [Pseudomonas capsici]MCV4283298.1 efflux transporter outer membrane subunit [Pseudomonas capsici]
MPPNIPLSKSKRSNLICWSVLSLALSVTGCSLAPDYRRPSLPVPLVQGTDLQAAPHPMVPGMPLSADETRLLTELEPDGELLRLVQQGLVFNRDFQVASLRVREAQALAGIAQADRLPTLSASLERDKQHFDNAALNERYGQNLKYTSVGVSDFELDFFGRVRSLSEAARHDYLATSYGQQAARSALIVEIARLYLAERLAAARQGDARRIDEAQQTLLGMAEEQQAAGAISFDDVAQEHVRAQDTRLQLQEALTDHARATQALLLVTGYATPLAREPEPSGPQVFPERSDAPETPAWLADMPSQRLLQRFDVRQSEEHLQAANANIGAARAAFFPSVRLSTGAGLASDGLRSLFDAGSGTWLFSPQISLPLFDAGRNRANLDLAQVRKEIAVAQYEQTVQGAFREVADVLAQRQLVLERLHSQQILIALAKSKAQRISTALDVGGASRLSLLSSRILIARTDMAWRQVRHDLLLNRLDIYRVLSGTDAAPAQTTPQTGASS